MFPQSIVVYNIFYIGLYFQSYHTIQVSQSPLSPLWNILDTYILTDIHSVVSLYVVVEQQQSLNFILASCLVILVWSHIFWFTLPSTQVYKICFIFALISSTYYTIYCVLCLCHFVFPFKLDINKYVFGTSNNFDYNQSNSCWSLLS